MVEVTNEIWKDNDYNDLVELWESGAKKFANNRLFGLKNDSGTFDWITFGEINTRIENFRGGLASLGVGKDDVVGIISQNSPEWAIGEIASYGLLARWVPMYEKERMEVWKYIIKDAGVKVLIVRTAEIFEKTKNLVDEIDSLETVVPIEGDYDMTMESLEKVGMENPIASKHPEPKDVACLIYTSGTTGDPKGVLLSHGNCCFACQAGYHFYQDSLNESTVSYSHLPWAHSYAIAAELHNVFQFGGCMALMRDLDEMVDDLQVVRPTVLISVPRVFNKVYTKIYSMMNEEGGLKLKLFNAAVAAAKKKFQTGSAGLKYKLLDKLVIDQIREKFGGRLKIALTASAKMNEEIALFFYSINIPTYDAYGMTETSPVITMNGPNGFKFGTVGKPVEKTKVVIDKSVNDEPRDDGEIVVYGPQVMLGYHNKPEKTKEVLMEDRGVRTGDRGKIDDEGFLHITGRIKQQYKLENGKYVFPSGIEEDIKLLPYVANAFVYGDGRVYNIAVIVLDIEEIQKWIDEMQLDINPKELLSGLSKSGTVIKSRLGEQISKSLKDKYAKYEIPRKYIFTSEDFTVENGMLTQTMKPKRKNIFKTYKKDIEQLYEFD